MKHAHVAMIALAATAAVTVTALAAHAVAPENVPAANGRTRPAVVDYSSGDGAGLYGAQVNSDGTMRTSIGATRSVAQTDAGTYVVDFDRDVSNCIYTASSYDQAVPVNVQPAEGDANGVFLQFYSIGGTDGAPTRRDARFYLQVYCGS